MKSKLCKAVVCFLCVAAMLSGTADAKTTSVHEKDLEDYVLSQMSPAHVSGMSISIVNSEKELYCAAYGVAGKTSKDYVLGDLSKSFTAAAIMRLAEDSELRLEDPVGDYLPEYTNISEITINDLLHHTSGISKYEVMSDIEASGKKGSFEYADANYNLLGEIIEAVTGASYMEYISDNILDPLEMESTYSIGNTEAFGGELVKGYRNYFGFPFPYENKYDKEEDWMQIPSNYLISDVKDMGSYLRMFLQEGGNVLSKNSVKAMLNEGVPVEDDQNMENEISSGKATYMMGWVEKKIDGERVLYHTGAVENYTAAMILLPGKDLGISMMFNAADAIAGNKLIQQMEKGILSIEMDKKAENIDGKSFYVRHGVTDAVMVLLILGAWMPIFLMAIWIKKRKNNLWSPLGIGMDAAVHIVLPTVLLIVLKQAFPVMWMKRFLPTVYYVAIAVIVSLYLGAAIKAAVMVYYAATVPDADAGEVDVKQVDSAEEQEKKAKKKEEKARKSDKAEKSGEEAEKPEKAHKSDKAERKEEEAEKPEKAHKSDKAEKKEEKAEKPEKVQKSDKKEKSDKAQESEDRKNGES